MLSGFLLEVPYIAFQKVEYEKELLLTAPVIRKLVASTIISRWEQIDTTIEICLANLNHYHKQIQVNLKKDCVT